MVTNLQSTSVLTRPKATFGNTRKNWGRHSVREAWDTGDSGCLGAIRPAPPSYISTCLQDYSIDEEAAFQAALALSLSEN